MKKFAILFLTLITLFQIIDAQEIKTPGQFLKYELGSRFTYLDPALNYFRYVAESSPKVIWEEYGTSYEGRSLGIAVITSEANHAKLDDIKMANIIKTGLAEGKTETDQLAIIWLGFNVHGNESVGLEAALKTLHVLATESFPGSKGWLDSCIIVIDPCQNPDGRERYTQFYNGTKNLIPATDGNSREHNQGWPGSRSNHYLFDLNRDWTWQTQQETRDRIKVYNSFMPHVHADFHEMGSESTFFFPPGAEPLHEVITPWQREFHKLTGDENAKLFNEAFRLYFTKEMFDLLCPSYGDTWPTFNGAIGFTYEQGGGGYAGLAVETETGDTITLSHRIEGHYLGAMATVSAAFKNRARLIKEFNTYYSTAVKEPKFEYKSIIIKGKNNRANINALTEVLYNNQIKWGYAALTTKKIEGFNYMSDKVGEVTIEKGDILIPLAQPQSNLVRVLFEPDTKASDSLSYDLTAWSLPYVYNLQAYALKTVVEFGKEEVIALFHNNEIPEQKPYAYIANFNGFDELKFMAKLYGANYKVRYALKPFALNGKKYERGTIIIARGDNKASGEKFDKEVTDIANKCNIELDHTFTGLVSEGQDMGSNYSPLNKAPNIAVVAGEGVSSGSFGELWYFFEQELQYPITVLGTDNVGEVSLEKYDIIILPSGNYSKLKDTLFTYVKAGGKILALENSISIFAAEKSTSLNKAIEAKKSEDKIAEKKSKSDDPALLKNFEDQRRYSISERSANSIYRVKLDDTHPYVFGMSKEWFVMKRSAGYPYLTSGNNIGYITESDPISGFAGYKYKEKIKNTIVIGSERMGKGEVIYISDNPYFRAYWKSGRTLLGNIILR